MCNEQRKMAEKPAWTFGPRELIGGLLDYAEKFADLNNEPEDGTCREAIRKGQAWFESGSATVDPKSVGEELVEYVQRYAETNEEPDGGNCKRLLAFAEHSFGSRKLTQRPALSRSASAGGVALSTHSLHLGVEGDQQTQLAQLLVSLQDLCAETGVMFEEALSDAKTIQAERKASGPSFSM